MVVPSRLDHPELADLRARLADRGERRRSALEQASTELDAMRPDLIEALEAGVPLAELARLSAVTRPTLYDLKRRAS